MTDTDTKLRQILQGIRACEAVLSECRDLAEEIRRDQLTLLDSSVPLEQAPRSEAGNGHGSGESPRTRLFDEP